MEKLDIFTFEMCLKKRMEVKMKNSIHVVSPSQLVKEVKGTMAIEGFNLNKHEINMLYRCASGKVSSTHLIKLLVKKHTQK